MATQVQFRRGTAAQTAAFTGALGEITVNTTDKSIVVHDGSTVGGFEAAKIDLSNLSGVGIITAPGFNGNLVGTAITVGSAVTITSSGINATGVVTATTFSGSGASLTGVPVSTGISGLGANVATFLATPSSANLASAVTDETGSGSLVFATSPTLVSPTLGNATATSVVSTNLNVSGVGTIATLNATYSTVTSENATNLNVSGVGTIANIRGANSSITGISTALDFNATSDINLKTNIVPITNSIEKIIKINGVSFNWKETQKPSIGVIAQNIEEVFPELVSEGETKTVNYNGLVGALIEAVKEQQKQIDILREEIENLKDN